MKAKLLTSRPGYKNEAVKPAMVKAGTKVRVTGTNKSGRMIGKTSEGWTLNFSQDEAEALE